jgi:hypothetical protein
MVVRYPVAQWLVRLVVGVVFLFNIGCALAFIARPAEYAPGFEISGVPGSVLVRGIGILFLMWNATYPPVLLRPGSHTTLLAVILVQQLIGVVGESWMFLTLPEGHQALRTTGLGFILFDGAALLAMAVAYAALVATRRHSPDSDRSQ